MRVSSYKDINKAQRQRDFSLGKQGVKQSRRQRNSKRDQAMLVASNSGKTGNARRRRSDALEQRKQEPELEQEKSLGR